METVLIYTHTLESMDALLDSTLELDIGNLSDDELDAPLGPLDEDSLLPTQRPSQITANYYWPNMSKHLKVYCSTCELYICGMSWLASLFLSTTPPFKPHLESCRIFYYLDQKSP